MCRVMGERAARWDDLLVLIRGLSLALWLFGALLNVPCFSALQRGTSAFRVCELGQRLSFEHGRGCK